MRKLMFQRKIAYNFHSDLIFTENLDKMTTEQVEKRDRVKMQVAEALKKY